MPNALAVVWDIIGTYHKSPDHFNPKALLALLYDFDRVLGLGLKDIKKESIPKKTLTLVDKREALRKQKNWAGADLLRKEIARLGWNVEDTAEGPIVRLR